jgi:hypothetical protein
MLSKGYFSLLGRKTTPGAGRGWSARSGGGGHSPLTVKRFHKSFIIQGFDDFCGV